MNKGRITKLNNYKSGKGCFIQIDGKQPDFAHFGHPDIKVGDIVVFETGKPMDDGRPTIKTIHADAIEAFEARDEDRVKPNPIPYRAHDAPKTDAKDEYWLNRGKQDLIKDATITRLSCISSACAVYEGAQGSDDKILALAAKFEAFAIGKKGV